MQDYDDDHLWAFARGVILLQNKKTVGGPSQLCAAMPTKHVGMNVPFCELFATYRTRGSLPHAFQDLLPLFDVLLTPVLAN